MPGAADELEFVVHALCLRRIVAEHETELFAEIACAGERRQSGAQHVAVDNCTNNDRLGIPWPFGILVGHSNESRDGRFAEHAEREWLVCKADRKQSARGREISFGKSTNGQLGRNVHWGILVRIAHTRNIMHGVTADADAAAVVGAAAPTPRKCHPPRSDQRPASAAAPVPTSASGRDVGQRVALFAPIDAGSDQREWARGGLDEPEVDAADRQGGTDRAAVDGDDVDRVESVTTNAGLLEADTAGDTQLGPSGTHQRGV